VRQALRDEADRERTPLERATRMLEQSRNAFNDTLEYLAAFEGEDAATAALISNLAASLYGPVAAIANLLLHQAEPPPQPAFLAPEAVERMAQEVWHAAQVPGAPTSAGDAAAAKVRELLS
jgi:hypothetical protein